MWMIYNNIIVYVECCHGKSMSCSGEHVLYSKRRIYLFCEFILIQLTSTFTNMGEQYNVIDIMECFKACKHYIHQLVICFSIVKVKKLRNTFFFFKLH